MSKGINLEGNARETVVDLADKVIEARGNDFATAEVLGDLCMQLEFESHPILKTLGYHQAPLDTSLREGQSWKPDNSRTWTEKRLGVGKHEVLKTREQFFAMSMKERAVYCMEVHDWAKAIKATALFGHYPTEWELARDPYLYIPDKVYFGDVMNMERQRHVFERAMKKSGMMMGMKESAI